MPQVYCRAGLMRMDQFSADLPQGPCYTSYAGLVSYNRTGPLQISHMVLSTGHLQESATDGPVFCRPPTGPLLQVFCRTGVTETDWSSADPPKGTIYRSLARLVSYRSHTAGFVFCSLVLVSHRTGFLRSSGLSSTCFLQVSYSTGIQEISHISSEGLLQASYQTDLLPRGLLH